jgi:hypothetical protein
MVGNTIKPKLSISSMIKLNRLNKVILIITLFFTYSAFAKDGNKFTKQEIIKRILPSQPYSIKQKGIGRAPVNIALCKYWGETKRRTKSTLYLKPFFSITLLYRYNNFYKRK